MDIVYFTDVESDTLHSNGMACILPITPFYSGENMRQTQWSNWNSYLLSSVPGIWPQAYTSPKSMVVLSFSYVSIS